MTSYRVIKRHADDYVAVDYPGLTDWPSVIAGVLSNVASTIDNNLADGESLTIVREFADGQPADRQRAWNRAVDRENHDGAALRASLSAVISPEQFRKMADWFDEDDAVKMMLYEEDQTLPSTWQERGHGLQDDLRKFADLLDGDSGD